MRGAEINSKVGRMIRPHILQGSRDAPRTLPAEKKTTIGTENRTMMRSFLLKVVKKVRGIEYTHANEKSFSFCCSP